MTPEEIQQKANEKVKAVEVLLRQLKLTTFAQQVVSKNGIIENMVFYKDNERYPSPPVEKKAVSEPLPVETKKEDHV